MSRPSFVVAVRRHPVSAFLLMAVGFSTIALIVARLAPDPVVRSRVPITIAKFGPSLAGLVTSFCLGGPDGVRELLSRVARWRFGWRWLGLALLAPPALFAVAAVIGAGGIPEVASLAATDLGSLLAVLLFTRVFLGGGLGEEPGWRGTLLPLLTDRYGAARGAALVGVAAGLWHLPANGVASAIALTTLTIPWSVILAWMYFSTGKSLAPCILAHGAGNASAAMFATLAPDLSGTFLFAAVLLSWIAALLVLPALRRVEGGGRASPPTVRPETETPSCSPN